MIVGVAASDESSAGNCSSDDPAGCNAHGNSMLQRMSPSLSKIKLGSVGSLWESMDAGANQRCLTIAVWHAVESQEICQTQAKEAEHDYYQFQVQDGTGGLCGTAPYCYDKKNVGNPWQIFKSPDATTCTCTNGWPAESSYCPSTGTAKCTACKDGYSLSTTTAQCEPTELWKKEANLRCKESQGNKAKVMSGCKEESLCQERAVRKRHRHFLYLAKKKSCWTGNYCETFEKNGWNLYTNPAAASVRRRQSLTVVPHDFKKPFSDTCPQYSDSLPNKDVFVKAHNYMRCLHGIDPLMWDQKVEDNSKIGSTDCAKEGRLEHTDCYHMDPPAAENLASGSNALLSTTAWYDEIILPDYEYPGEKSIKVSGHYTAMIWKDTEKFGCSEKVNHDPKHQEGGYVVDCCQYADVPGNMGGTYEHNVPKTIWTNEVAFCCQESFDAPDCDFDCEYQAFRLRGWEKPR